MLNCVGLFLISMFMKSFHIILEGHTLGENLGYKNIEIAKSFGLDAHMHPGVKITKTFEEEFNSYGITKIASLEAKLKGQQGCFLAHFQLWQKCLDLNESIVICEHDGVFIRNIPTNLEFTDILRLDTFEHWKTDYNFKIEKSLKDPITVQILPTDYQTHYVGYYGYIISPQGAKKLIKRAQRKGIKSVDRFIDKQFVDIKSVSASIVRLDKTYIGRVKELSTTAK